MGAGRGEIGQVTVAGGVQHAEARAVEGLDRGMVDGARALRAAEDEDHGSPGPSPNRSRAAVRSVDGAGPGRPVTR